VGGYRAVVLRFPADRFTILKISFQYRRRHFAARQPERRAGEAFLGQSVIGIKPCLSGVSHSNILGLISSRLSRVC
jgi:hypothetical protein